MITHMVYVSQASRSLLNSQYPINFELNEISKRACSQNRAISVTGILLYKDGHFLQVLEGNGLVLKKLFEKISKDPRHCEVEQLAAIETEERLFEKWNMGLVNLDEATELDRSMFDDTIHMLRYVGAKDEKLARDGILKLLRLFIDDEAPATVLV